MHLWSHILGVTGPSQLMKCRAGMLSLVQGHVGCWQSTSCSSRQGRLPWESQLLPQLGRGSCAEGSGQTVPFLLMCDPSSSSSVLRKPSLGNNFPSECRCSPTRQFLAVVRQFMSQTQPRHQLQVGKGGGHCRALEHSAHPQHRLEPALSLHPSSGTSAPVQLPAPKDAARLAPGQSLPMGCTAPLPHGAQGNQHHSPHPSLNLLPFLFPPSRAHYRAVQDEPPSPPPCRTHRPPTPPYSPSTGDKVTSLSTGTR